MPIYRALSGPLPSMVLIFDLFETFHEYILRLLAAQRCTWEQDRRRVDSREEKSVKLYLAKSNELGEYEEQASSASEVWRPQQFLVAATKG